MMTHTFTLNTIDDALRDVQQRQRYYLSYAQASYAELGRGFVLIRVYPHQTPYVDYFPTHSLHEKKIIPPTLRDNLYHWLQRYRPRCQFVVLVGTEVGGKTAWYGKLFDINDAL